MTLQNGPALAGTITIYTGNCRLPSGEGRIKTFVSARHLIPYSHVYRREYMALIM